MPPPSNLFLWQQFGASIDMLENAITACPNELWNEEPTFCQLSHHTLFFLHYYLCDETPDEEQYTPPPPFTKSEFEDTPTFTWHTQKELLNYAKLGRQRLHKQLSENTGEELLTKRFVNAYKDFTLFELLLYNMRHVQHHTAQLNLLLRQKGIIPPDWVSRNKEPL